MHKQTIPNQIGSPNKINFNAHAATDKPAPTIQEITCFNQEGLTWNNWLIKPEIAVVKVTKIGAIYQKLSLKIPIIISIIK